MRARRYIRPVLRLATFIAALCALLLYLDYRVARASVMEHLLGIGQRMAPFLDDAHSVEAPREVHVNGLRMWVAAGHTDHRPAEVRSWYAARYAGKGTVTDVMTEALKSAKMLPPTVDGLSQAEFGDDRMGGMAALDMGNHVDIRMLQNALRKLVTGKIGEVGHFRYLYYERNADRRHALFDGVDRRSVRPDEVHAVGQRGRAGARHPGRAALPGTYRVLSGDERGRAAQMAVYTGPGSPETAAMFYDARMQHARLAVDPHFSAAAGKQGLPRRAT